MAKLSVNPTRMELRRLKSRLRTAERGKKLLKDKSEEMIRQFTGFVKENKRLREELEGGLRDALNKFMLAKSLTPLPVINQAFAIPSFSVSVKTSSKNVMGITVPSLEIDTQGEELLPYNFAGISSEMDEAIESLSKLIERLLKLAQIEKTCNMLAAEIEKNRRRVNALEYFLIPQLNETIKYIMMKLDENERSTIIRLMKVKSIIAKND